MGTLHWQQSNWELQGKPYITKGRNTSYSSKNVNFAG
jgi:hypothetical protein